VATQTSLKTAFIVTVIATTVGTLVGAVAGYYGKLADAALMRFTDLVLTVPLLAILLVLANVLTKSNGNFFWIAIIVAAVLWTYLARLVRGTFLSLREHDYVLASRAIGATDARIILRHMIPNAFGPIVVNGTLTVANAVLIESALSFLGLGIQPPAVSLGSLINSGQGSATTEWWLFAFPSAVLVLIVLAVNFVGDGLRDALDPRQRRVRA
jgi:peptide/nickel transport system permease protein